MNHPWDVFHGQLDSGVARVYVRARDQLRSRLIEGYVRGPYTAGQTIPHSVNLKQTSETLWEALIFDPVSWAPGHGVWYQVVLETEDAHERHTLETQIGLRHLGVRGDQFFWEAQSFQLTAIELMGNEPRTWEIWKDQRTVPFFSSPTQDDLSTASRLGVPVGLSVAFHESADSPGIAAAARWPATSFVWLRPAPAGDASAHRESLKQRFPNMIFIQELENGDAPPSWVDALAAKAAQKTTRPFVRIGEAGTGEHHSMLRELSQD